MILVTGAAGYLGSHIVKRLAEAGKPVRALIRNRAWAEAEGRLAGLNIEWAEGDVTKPETLAGAVKGVEAVVHTVAIAIESGGRKYEDINYQGTVNIVNAANAAGVKRFVNICQLGADSKLPYRFLASKGKAQEYVAASGLDWTAFRPSVIWGPEDEFANTFAKLAPLSPLIYPIIGDGQARFQPVWVEDVAAAVVKSLDDPSTAGQEFELGGPEVLTIGEIERRTLNAIGARRLLIPFPVPLLRIVVTLMQVVFPAPPVTTSLLDLLGVDNTAKNNALGHFVAQPKPFTTENAAPYMRQFKVGNTLRQFFGQPVKV
ncbi:MAG TPA: complex I NDUFA9 subunit family protein [Anaerolineales bacterium]|nr:complex I NDUFA9 subunit family protein [Anaerolineales bacterium]